MGTYTDTYVEMLQQDLQHQYRRCNEVGEELVQALQASEAKDEELTAAGQLLNLQMDATAQVEKKLVDALGVLSDRDIEVERVTNDLEIARRTIENLDTNSSVLYIENQRLETQFGAVKKLLDAERNNTAQVEKKLVDTLGVLSDRNMEVTRLDLALKDTDEEVASLKERLDLEAVTLSNALRAVSVRDIEIERLTFALKDKDNELESVLDEHRTQIDELMTEIERLTRKNKKPFKVAELRWLIDGHTNVLDEHRTAILEVREAIDQNKETLSSAQREMLATLDRHDGLISKAFGCIGNNSDSIYNQQQSIDALWLYVQSIAAHINTGSRQENP